MRNRGRAEMSLDGRLCPCHHHNIKEVANILSVPKSINSRQDPEDSEGSHNPAYGKSQTSNPLTERGKNNSHDTLEKAFDGILEKWDLQTDSCELLDPEFLENLVADFIKGP